ncbi:hypothetical protein DPMN_159241 [Dreissena polymorpha]|uniref:Uncharacterized protein n=1 Tax=Dreissena polymorpha TaxID=45954 RepID=A0A9D4IQJ2_DREPO|nr:hypothetical protein DPMN_159241 [Dreissena polymorpha]
MWTSLALSQSHKHQTATWDPKHIVPMVENVNTEEVLSMAEFNRYHSLQPAVAPPICSNNKYSPLDIDNYDANDTECHQNHAKSTVNVGKLPKQDVALCAPTCANDDDKTWWCCCC